ncbi:MAG: hypothetical protein QOI07_51 [Verrucomicrobiota bacterium]|jgi:hypothetical protein
MSDFIKFWEVFQVFPKYSSIQKVAILAGIPLFLYVLYLVTVARPPLINHVLTIRAAPLMTPTGTIVNAEGVVTILWSLGNDSAPQAELHNIKGEFRTTKKHLVNTSLPPTRQTEFRGETSIFYDLSIPLLHKNDGGIFLKWEFKVPPVGEDIQLNYEAIASETDWQWGSFKIANEGNSAAFHVLSKKP